MKHLLIFSILTLTTQAYAESEDSLPAKETILRIQDCKGSVSPTTQGEDGAPVRDETQKVSITATIVDRKLVYTGTTEAEESFSFIEYDTSFELKIPNQTQEHITRITSNDTGKDPIIDRNQARDGMWSGLTFFNLFLGSMENRSDDMEERDGLVVLEREGRNKFNLIIQYGEIDDKDVRYVSGPLSCKNRK